MVEGHLSETVVAESSTYGLIIFEDMKSMHDMTTLFDGR